MNPDERNWQLDVFEADCLVSKCTSAGRHATTLRSNQGLSDVSAHTASVIVAPVVSLHGYEKG